MRASDDLVRQGKVRYMGCSNHSAWHVMKALAVSDAGDSDQIRLQQVNYSLIAREVEHEIIPLGLDQSVGLMAWSPLHAAAVRQVPPRCAAPGRQPAERAGCPGTIDFERVYRIVDVLVDIARAREVSRRPRWR